VFGTEAIWWLNSALLAALTHVGVLWMLAFAEPEKAELPVETKIIIETLPAAEDVSKSQAKTETKPVEERLVTPQVDENEKTKASGDTDQVAKVTEQEQIVGDDLSSERLKEARSSGNTDAVTSRKTAAKPTKADDTLSPTSGSIQPEQASPVDRVTTTVQPEEATQAIAPEAEQAKIIGKVDTALATADRVDRESPIAPTATPDRPTSVQSSTETAVTPPDSTTATRVTANSEPERVAVLRQKPAPVQSANPAASSSVKTKTAVKSIDESTKAKPQKKFVFPKNVKRLAPASTKPSTSVTPKRLAAVVGGGATSRNGNSANTGPSPRRLKQVAIANTSRPSRVEPDSRYRDLLRFLEQGEVEGCATVLPTIAPDGSVALSGFAADESLWTSFQASMADELRIRLPLDAARVAKPQCRALTFARTLPDYPRFSLGMNLENSNLVSGQSLDGTITDARGRNVHLVIVDDEGLVQQIDGFLQPKVSSLTFSVAVSVRNQVVPTAQMLIALAVERPLETVTSANQTLAEQFFAAVTEELAATKQKADIAIVSFYLRSAENE